MKLVTHLVTSSEPSNNRLSQSFHRQNHCLSAIKLLCQLTKAVQQHRGATMAYLSGEPAFLPLIEKLHGGIERLLAALSLLNNEQYGCMPDYIFQNINDDWKTIVIGWKDDRVLRNFEFHCHLVDTLNKLLRHCMREELLPHINDNNRNYRALLETLLVQIPHNIESLAMLRGLSTNAAVVSACGSNSHTKISYLLKEIPDQNKRLTQQLLPFFTELHIISDQQKALHKLLLTIQIAILDCPDITTDSATLFQLSTDIIDAHWLAIEQGIQLVEKQMYQQLANL